MDLAEGELDAYRDKKSVKELNNQFEVAIGDGMEFTIHGKYADENEKLLAQIRDFAEVKFFCGNNSVITSAVLYIDIDS